MAKATQHKLDMSKVKDGGGNFNKKRQKEGDYKAKVIQVEDAKPKSDGDKTPMWLFTIKAGSGTYPYYCKLQENQLWKVRNLFVAAGLSVPKKKLNVDPNKVVGKTIAVTLADTEYDNKEQSEIDAVFPASELDDDDLIDDDEEAEDDEDSDEEEDDEEESDDEDDEDDEDEEEEEKPKKKKKAKASETKASKSKSSKKGGKKKKAAKSSDDDELDIEDV